MKKSNALKISALAALVATSVLLSGQAAAQTSKVTAEDAKTITVTTDLVVNGVAKKVTVVYDKDIAPPGETRAEMESRLTP
jgi:uncharacterized membrane protein